MKLKTLKLQNFRQHEDSFIEFPEGITIINGQNGAGKSTILEAITWAIYGTEAARGNKDSIKFNRAKPRSKVMVELVFSLDGETYKIARFLDKSEVYVGENESPIVTTQQEVTNYLTEKLGMTKNEFFNTYFTGQKELNFLASQKRVEKRKFISKVLNYEKIRETQEKIRIDKNDTDRELKGLKQGLDDNELIKKEKKDAVEELLRVNNLLETVQKSFNQIAEKLSKLEPEWEEVKSKKDNFEKLQREKELLEEKKSYLSENFENLNLNILKKEEKLKELKELESFEIKYKECEKQIKEQESYQEQDNIRQKHLNRLELLEKELLEKEEQLEKVVKSGKEKRISVEKIPDVKKEIDSLQKEIQDFEKENSNKTREIEVLVQQKENEIKKINKQQSLIEQKGKDGACPTCERPLKDEFEKVINGFNEQLLELNKQVESLEKEKKDIISQKSLIEEKVKHKKLKEQEYDALIGIQGEYKQEQVNYKQIKTELDQKQKEKIELKQVLESLPKSFSIEKLKELRQEIVFLREKYEKILSLRVEVSSLENLKKEIDTVKTTLQETNLRTSKNIENIKNIDFSEEKYKETEINYTQNKEIFYKTREELVKTQSEEKNIKDKIERIEKTEKAYQEKISVIEQMQEKINLLSELDRFYGQFWEKLNNEARPEISEIASRFLSELTDGRYSQVELNENYEIQLHDDGEIKPVISGGEEDIVNLCIRLAISQIIAQRSGKSFSILILDEIFGSLDESRRNNVVMLLRNLSSKFEQIILITHIEDIKEEIDNTITIGFDPERGCSFIS